MIKRKQIVTNPDFYKLNRFSRTWLVFPLLMLIKVYRNFIKPFIPSRCRYVPSCSQYSMEALETYGFFKGMGYIIKRIFRCHPFGSHGFDPLPEKNNTSKN